jgi:hypothetical protein
LTNSTALDDRRRFARWSAPARALQTGSDRLGSAAAFVVTAAVVGLLGADQGGYFPGAWAVATPILAVVVIAVLALARDLRIPRAGLVMAGGLAGLCAWTAASALWSHDTTATTQDARRVLLYVAGTAALVLLARRGRASAVALGVLAAVTAVDAFSLTSRFYPRQFGMFDITVSFGRLYQPIGYWNGLGSFSVIGILLALGFAARGRLAVRMFAAAALVVLAPTLYLTFSRGALVALAAGLVVLVSLDRRRVQLIAFAGAASIGGIAAVVTIHGHAALTTLYRHLDEQAVQGAAAAATLISLVPLGMGGAALAAGLETRYTAPRGVRRAAGACLIALVCVALGLGIHRLGNPLNAVHSAVESFRKPAPTFPKGDLNRRLLSLSTNGRVLFWKAAWHDFTAHPVIGSGGGTYERYWVAHRPVHIRVRNAHSLYLETAAELGVIGLIPLLIALVAPLWVGLRRLRYGLGAPLVAAYVAYLVQAGGDWTWQLPAVTLAALACGAAMLGLDPDEGGVPISERWRLAGILIAVAIAVAGLTGAGG